jgi:hypothetical protein
MNPELVKKVLENSAKSLIDIKLIESLWQVGIVKYDVVNKVASHLMLCDDFVDPYTHPRISRITDQFNTIKREYSKTNSLRTRFPDFFSKPAFRAGPTLVLMCNTLRKIRFECCVTEVLYDQCCEKGARTGFQGLGWGNRRYTGQEFVTKRKRQEDWEFGCTLEETIFLGHKVYLTSFFSSDNEILGVAAFLADDETAQRSQSIIEKILDQEHLDFVEQDYSKEEIEMQLLLEELDRLRKQVAEDDLDKAYHELSQCRKNSQRRNDQKRFVDSILGAYRSKGSITVESVKNSAKLIEKVDR